MSAVGIFDSGAGGLSVLRELRKLLPERRYIYYSDNANCPYGTRDQEFIIERCRTITRMLTGKGADIIVVACNTATSAAIATLREEFSVPFIGMEPAVKPAAAMTVSGVIGVLATEGTLRGSKYHDTREKYGEDVKIIERVGAGFVELVESMDFDGPHAESIVRSAVEPMLAEGADTIVLGCTHYPFLSPLISSVAGPGVKIVNPAPAVARHMLDVVLENGLPLSDPEPGVELLSSGPDCTLRALFERG